MHFKHFSDNLEFLNPNSHYSQVVEQLVHTWAPAELTYGKKLSLHFLMHKIFLNNSYPVLHVLQIALGKLETIFAVQVAAPSGQRSHAAIEAL